MAATAPDHSTCDATGAPAPGGVYLCQVSATVSCGACCGLYNTADLTRAALEGELRDRTLAFARVPRTAEAVDAFARAVENPDSRPRPLKDFHHCPFIGLVGTRLSRVGCLLHPLAAGNQGIDYRGLSYYGGLACRGYFCPTTHKLAPRHKRVLRSTAGDWFAYGLLVTEEELLEGLFSELETTLGGPVRAEMFIANAEAGQKLRELLGLKLTWPFRLPGAHTLCHYFFKDNLYPRPRVDYRRLGCRPSRLDPILTQLGSSFETRDSLRRAEQLIERNIRAVANSLADTFEVPSAP